MPTSKSSPKKKEKKLENSTRRSRKYTRLLGIFSLITIDLRERLKKPWLFISNSFWPNRIRSSKHLCLKARCRRVRWAFSNRILIPVTANWRTANLKFRIKFNLTNRRLAASKIRLKSSTKNCGLRMKAILTYLRATNWLRWKFLCFNKERTNWRRSSQKS